MNVLLFPERFFKVIVLYGVIPRHVFFVIIFRLNGNLPACWEGAVMCIQLICFEVETAEHWGHREGLPVRKMDKTWSHSIELSMLVNREAVGI